MDKDHHTTEANGNPHETPREAKTRLRSHADNHWTLRNKLILITTLGSAIGLCGISGLAGVRLEGRLPKLEDTTRVVGGRLYQTTNV
jgi:hypothetical protein